jgi:tetratricopeptide (TPR) repeat protein
MPLRLWRTGVMPLAILLCLWLPVQAQGSESSGARPPSAASAVFQILASELALQQGQIGVALATYISLAESSRDPGVAERATRIALTAQAPRQALRAAVVWLETQPESADAQDIADLLRLQFGFYTDLRNSLTIRKRQADKAGAAAQEAFFERLAGLTSQTQDPAKVLALIESVAGADKGHRSLLYARAMLYERMQDYKTMESLLRQLMLQDPSHAHARNALGYSFADRGVRLEEAEVLIHEALALLPEDPHILDSLGWVYFRQGKLDAAVRWLSDAHRRQPDAEISAHLGEALWALTRKEEALAVFRLGLSHDPDNAVLKNTLKRLGVALESTTDSTRMR